MTAAARAAAAILLGEPTGAVARRPNFRALVGESAWAALPPAVRARFDAAAHHQRRAYPGTMTLRLGRLGWMFAQGCRLLGTPIAPFAGVDVPAVVDVRPDAEGAIVWKRVYARPGRKPLAIASRKLAAPDGSLLEVTRGGLGMRLDLTVEDGALVFRSTAYVWRIGPWLIPIPAALTPGRAT